jgi:Cdc6-like AAA superfamily ATPase
MIEVTFLQATLGCLWKLGLDVAVTVVASEVHQRIRARDLASLLEHCFDKALAQDSEFVNQFCRPPVPNGPTPRAYIAQGHLLALLESNQRVNPLTVSRPEGDPWLPYLGPFREIVVIPGFPFAEEEHLLVVQRLLKKVAKCFDSELPSSHPAFEQMMLALERRHAADHQRILEAIEAIPERTAVQLAEREAAEPGRAAADPPTVASEWQNPFSDVAADDLDLGNPDHVRRIGRLFVSRYTDLPKIKKRFNTVLEGQRGTGKTMIMKYLAFPTQIMEWSEKEKRKPSDFFASANNFVGVYSKLAQGIFDKFEEEIIGSRSRTEQVFEHRLVLHLLYDVLETMRSVYSHMPPQTGTLKLLRKALEAYLKPGHSFDDLASVQELLGSAQLCIQFDRVTDVDQYLGSIAPGGAGPAGAFSPWLTLESSLFPFLRFLRQSCSARVPFYMMLDDFDVLSAEQQACVFKAAAMREFGTVCFKFGVMVFGRKTNLAGQQRTFRIGDDYDPIDLDWTEGGLHTNYHKAITDIAVARLCEAGWVNDLPGLFPAWSHGEKILAKIHAEMADEWEKSPPEHRPTLSKSDYVSKYGNARFFQHLRSKKIRYRYAGFESITMVSSGIFRQFMEACKYIVDRAHDGGWCPQDGGIPAEVQDAAIREYSEVMIDQFSWTAGDAAHLLAGDIGVTSMHMVRLIESLCDLFYSRLHTPWHGEPEIICLAIRDDLTRCDDVRLFLQIAVRESILHRFRYPPKSAGGPDLPAFMLNRRLGPRRDLSITRMQGRIEVDAADVRRAVEDRHVFLQRFQSAKHQSATTQTTMPLSIDQQ